MRYLRVVVLASALVIATSGCQLLQSAKRFASAPGVVDIPFWCDSVSGTTLNVNDCQRVSGQLDLATFFAYRYFHASDATAAGATSSPYATGVGAAFHFRVPASAFDAANPDTLLYDGATGGAQVAGIEWNVTAASAPAGFIGPNDEWTDVGAGVWQLRAWILRPFQNEPNVFAISHPCLAPGGPVYDITAACYRSTHPVPLKILVSNDDGYNAPGLDAAVQALRDLPNVNITVSAPATDKSGTGGTTSPPPLTATARHTLSGYPAWAVDGYPADSVQYALDTLHANPDLLIAGINRGQNTGQLISVSGTVGAARVGGRVEIPSVALSQGLAGPGGGSLDYPSGVDAMLDWVNDFLFGRVGPPFQAWVTNINIPTCPTGPVRGTAVLPAATSGNPFATVNCLSTKTTFADDIDGFVNGYVTVTSIGT